MENNVKILLRISALHRVLFTLCLFIISGTGFSQQSDSAIADSSHNVCLTDVTATHLFAQHHSNDHPLVPGPSPVEQVPGTGESEEDSDDEFSRLLGNASVQFHEIPNGRECLSTQLRLSVKNRSSVSLIVLHHSWKSFLA